MHPLGAALNLYSPSSSGSIISSVCASKYEQDLASTVRREVDAAVRREDAACPELQITIELWPDPLCGLRLRFTHKAWPATDGAKWTRSCGARTSSARSF
ncbi:hypothetical protein N9L68_04495 [bacterium]|nr:hypothetical protein [bacterium]